MQETRSGRSTRQPLARTHSQTISAQSPAGASVPRDLLQMIEEVQHEDHVRLLGRRIGDGGDREPLALRVYIVGCAVESESTRIAPRRPCLRLVRPKYVA